MRYDSFRYLWPPRPDTAIPAAMLPVMEARGWVATIKKDGTCNVMAVAPDRTITAMTRHNSPHKAWQPDDRTQRAFQGLPGGWYVFVSELLHSKVKGGARHTNFIHDILVADSESLIGTTYLERQELLEKLFPNRATPIHTAPNGIGYTVIDEFTWLASIYRPGTNYANLFAGLKDAADEGIVIKNPTARLEVCAREASNSSWQMKTRRPSKRAGSF